MALSISCQAVLFDMDGTLVDSTQSVETIWGKWAARHHQDLGRILATAHGRRTVDTLRDIAPHLDIEAEAALLETEEISARDGIKQVAGAASLIASLPVDRWCVVTSASRPLAEARLHAAGLPIPAVLICSADVSQGKPHPEGYQIAAAALGVAPSTCLVLEDTPAGIAAGRAAGMQVLALTTTFPPERLLGASCIPDYQRIAVSVTADGINWHA